jgi:DNA primase
MNLPDHIKQFFAERKISEKTLEDFGISWDGNRIVYPVRNLEGKTIFCNYRRDPVSEMDPKYMYDKGASVSLYGADKIKDESTVVICEGQNDALVCWSNGIPAVTSTGGALSFQEDWAELLNDKEVLVAMDDDKAGAQGTVKILNYLPRAKVVLFPIPNDSEINDISDMVIHGGDLHELMKTARCFEDIEEVTEDMHRRIAIFQSVHFHEAYLKEHTKIAPVDTKRKTFSSDAVTNAKEYPLTNLLEFRNNKMNCPWHNDTNASLTYYPKSNNCYCFGCSKVVDSIEAYMHLHGVSFSEAVKEINKL